MQQDTPKPVGGIRLRSVIVWSVVVSAALSGLLLIAMLSTTNSYASMRKMMQDYIDCQTAAYSMQQGSDYLTEHARLFVMTGVRKYADLFADEVNNGAAGRRRWNRLPPGSKIRASPGR